jgi:hypothetical protein
MELRVSIYTDVPSRQPLSKPAIQIGDNRASTSPTTLNDSHAHNSHCRWPPRPILVCDRLRHGAAADAPTVGISYSQPLVDRRLIDNTEPVLSFERLTLRPEPRKGGLAKNPARLPTSFVPAMRIPGERLGESLNRTDLVKVF